MVEKDIGKIKKNDTSDIVIRIDEFGGRKGVTIREFVTSERYTGFTKAGVKIPARDFLAFREMINSIPLEDLKEDETAEKKTSAPRGQKKLSNSNDNMPDY